MSAKLGFEGGWFENRVFSSSLLFSELFPVSLRIVASLTAGGAGGGRFQREMEKRSKFSISAKAAWEQF